jgi:hypothetical protein
MVGIGNNVGGDKKLKNFFPNRTGLKTNQQNQFNHVLLSGLLTDLSGWPNGPYVTRGVHVCRL